MSQDYDSRLSVTGSGPAIVLVPGMDGTGQLFYRQVPLLARSHQVATYALRDAADSMDALVDDLADIITRIAPDGQATVLGESFGGALALSFAVARPDLVRRLVILNSFAYFAPQWRLHFARTALGALPWGTMALVRRMTAFRLHSPHTHRAEVRRFMELTEDSTREGYLNRLKMLTRYDVREHLRELHVPTLYLAAECDHLIPSVSQAKYMTARTPHSTMRILSGHGHICLIAPDIDLERILEESFA
jgi:pimeloyl-ACP methyl ester carboxylesterase